MLDIFERIFRISEEEIVDIRCIIVSAIRSAMVINDVTMTGGQCGLLPPKIIRKPDARTHAVPWIISGPGPGLRPAGVHRESPFPLQDVPNHLR